MFERLGEVRQGIPHHVCQEDTGQPFVLSVQIYANHEVYLTDLDHDEVPALFWWFPNQEDYQPPPPADETPAEKLQRLSAALKSARIEVRRVVDPAVQLRSGGRAGDQRPQPGGEAGAGAGAATGGGRAGRAAAGVRAGPRLC